MHLIWQHIPGRFTWLILFAAACFGQPNVAVAPGGKAIAHIHAVQRVAGSYFYLQSDAAGRDAALMVRKRKAAKARKLLDLETLTPGSHSSRFEIQPSWDGKYVAVGASPGRDGYWIRIVDVATGTLLPEAITRSFDGDASWSDDNHAFYYRRFQQVPVGSPRGAIFTNMRAYRHELGHDPSLDKAVFGPDVNPELHLPTVGAVNAFPLPHTTLLLGVQSSAPAELDSFWASDAGAAGNGWRKIIDHKDQVLFEFSSRGNTLYFISRRNAPSGRLMAFDADHEDIASAREILPASELQLSDRDRDGVVCAKDALYVYGHRKGVSVLVRLPYDDAAHRSEIALPYAGVIADVSGDSRTPGIVFSLAGDGHSPLVFEYDSSKNRVIDTGLTRSRN